MKFKAGNPNSKIVIVGAGPAGASLAIRLAQKNFEVCLIERERFPRQKLCGEFISPECLRHFRELEVFDEMLAAGGERIEKTVFYAPNGKSVAVPSRWFNDAGETALGLSRAEMDFRLLEKAKKLGVEVFEETQIAGLLFETEAVCGVKVKTKDGKSREIFARLTVDATGRARVLSKMAEREINSKFKIQNSKLNSQIRNPQSAIRNRLVGFKTHLENASVENGTCEIYFFRGGYGGLSFIENNLANHCFLISAETVRQFGGDARQIVEKIVFQNKRARDAMSAAKPVFEWLAVSVDNFGAKTIAPLDNLFAVGDAAAFIDPFTGSGMLMALESAEILAFVIADKNASSEEKAEKYKALHRRKFQNRLRVCSVLRKAAFAPELAKLAVYALGFSEKTLRALTRATRKSVPVK